MKVDEMITLNDGKSYGLLLDTEIESGKYFLAVLLNSKEEPTNNFKVFKETIKDNETYVDEEKDPLILSKLLEDYYLQVDED